MNATPDQNLFFRKPLDWKQGIPLFSTVDQYVANYQKIAWDHISAIKPESSNPFIGDDLWREMEVSTRKLVTKYSRPGDRVLDVGVGLGRILAPFDDRDRHGIDISIEYLKQARLEGINVVFSKIEDMPFKDDVFDMVIVTDVLEHVFDLNLCTTQILRILKPGGVLIVRVPYKEDLSPYLSETLPYEFVHLRNFDENSLRLHFSKIFGLSFLESEPVAPYLQGAARLRIKLFDAHECKSFQDSKISVDPDLEILREISKINSEQFTEWLYELQEKCPDKYRLVKQQVVMGIEINAVFRKPSAEESDIKPRKSDDQSDAVSNANASFWDELCGSQAAQFLGIKDSSKNSLKRFDEWYFDFYPYLLQHIPFDQVCRCNVLEIGLGYGTVSQRLAESGAKYTGLDIAKGPVVMVNQRLLQSNLLGEAMQGSILKPPFGPESFDLIVAIGCLHHTGDLKKAIAQCHKLLRPGGKLIFMVYYAYSYRRFRQAPIATLKYLMREQCGYRGCVGPGSERERAAYDAGAGGAGAPHTDWISVRSLEHYCSEFSKFSSKLENIDQEWPFPFKPRTALLKTNWPSKFGLDLYATATK